MKKVEPHPVWLLVVLLAGQFMANIDIAIVNVAAPSIGHGLGASDGELEFVVSGYTIAFAMLLITGARLGSLHGYRGVFLIGLAGFTVASLGCGLAPDPAVLIAARITQGGCAALMVSQVLSGIQLNFSGTARARALGGYALALSGGAVVGQVLGGVIVSTNLLGASWRPIFLINVPIGIAGLLVGWRVLPTRLSSGRRLDLAGVVALSATVSLLVVPLAFGRDAGWPGWTWACLLASVPAGVVFVAVERRVAATGGHPLIDLSLVRRPTIRWGLLGLACSTSTYYGMLFVIALYLQRGLGRSPLYSGLALVSWVAAFGIAGPLLPRLREHVRPLLAPVGGAILGSAYLAISVTAFSGAASGVPLIILLGCGGLGLGTMFSSMIAHLTSSVGPRHAADISGLLTTNAQLAAVIGVATFGTLYAAADTTSGTRVAQHAFSTFTLVIAAVALLAALFGYLAVRRRRAGAGYATQSDGESGSAGIETARSPQGESDSPRHPDHAPHVVATRGSDIG